MHDFISKILKLSKKMTPNDMGQIKLIGIPTYQNQISKISNCRKNSIQ